MHFLYVLCLKDARIFNIFSLDWVSFGFLMQEECQRVSSLKCWSQVAGWILNVRKILSPPSLIGGLRGGGHSEEPHTESDQRRMYVIHIQYPSTIDHPSSHKLNVCLHLFK